jgi:hypothetical protein
MPGNWASWGPFLPSGSTNVTIGLKTIRSWNSWTGITTGYGVDGLGSIPGRGKKFFYIPQCLEQFWGSLTPPPSNGYRGYSSRDVKLTPQNLVQLSMVELYLHSPIRLHGVVRDWLSTGASLPFFFQLCLNIVDLPTYPNLSWNCKWTNKDHTVRTNATPFTFARMATNVFCSSNFGFVSSIIVMRCKIRFKRVQFDTVNLCCWVMCHVRRN